jgi:hypothetical protein
VEIRLVVFGGVSPLEIFYGLAECMNCSPICCNFQKTPEAESHHAPDHDGRAPLASSLCFRTLLSALGR